MPKQISLFRVFLASPSDLHDEREIVGEVIDELNTSAFLHSDVQVQLLKWENAVNPGIANYPQQVINSDIGKDYDIFLGILWSKFGTPTPQYGSGTEEEYQIAVKNRSESPSKEIMIYFKTAPIPFKSIDPESIRAINNFKNNLGDDGVLYWEFNSTDEFRKLLRMQLMRKVQDLKQIPREIENLVKPIQEDIYEEELGLIDYSEIGEESIENLLEILNRISSATVWIGKRFEEMAREIDAEIAKDPEMGNKKKRRLVNSAADDMHSYVQRIKAEIPLYSENIEKAIDSYSNAIKISIEMGSEEVDELEAAISSIKEFVLTIEESIESGNEFLEVVKSLPRMTKEFNRAKRTTSKTLEELYAEFQIGINLANAMISDLKAQT
ncbi:DUF4062 domain-containing protein [bacterium SCSIO 12741]|nr:DUF4062 domain-containing protein [bacterium SCSIO 12741]